MRRVWRQRPYPVDESCKLYLPFYKYGSNAQKIWDISTSRNDGTISGSVSVAYPMLIPITSGTVTLANMKISAVDGGTTASGGAFVDFSAASVLTDYVDHLLVIKDSSNRVIQGIIKAAGTAEGLSSELITGWTNSVTYPYETWDGSSPPDITSAINTVGDYGLAYHNTIGTSTRKLFKLGFNITKNAGTMPFIEAGSSQSGVGSLSQRTPAAGVNSFYFTSIAANLVASFETNGTTATNFSTASTTLKQILTPGSTGVTIVNQKDGVTYNWISKDANFSYADSSNYTYTIYSIPGYMGLGWFADGTDDRITHTSLNLGTTHTLHYWLLYEGISGVIHGGAANYHGMRLSPTACGYNVGTTEVTVTHSATIGEPVLFSIDRNGTSVTFYKNGVKTGTTQTLDANTAQVLTDLFRYSNGTSYWNGIIFDTVAINTNKGAQEIRNFFEMTRSIYGV